MTYCLEGLLRKNEVGQVEVPELCNMLRSLGFIITDAKRIFRFLDFKGAKEFKPPAGLSVADISWLRRLPQVVCIEAVALGSKDGMTELEALQHVTRTAMTARQHRVGATTPLQRNSKFALPQARPKSARSSSRSRISQREFDAGAAVLAQADPYEGHTETSEPIGGGDGDASAGIIDGPASLSSSFKGSSPAINMGRVQDSERSSPLEGFGAGGGLMSPRGSLMSPRGSMSAPTGSSRGSLPRHSFARRLSANGSVVGAGEKSPRTSQMSTNLGEEREPPPGAKEVFDMLDRNNDGFITKTEMQQAFGEAEASVPEPEREEKEQPTVVHKDREPPPQAEEVFDMLDRNNDGIVTTAEMQQAFDEVQVPNEEEAADDYNDDYNDDQDEQDDDYQKDDDEAGSPRHSGAAISDQIDECW